MKKLYNFRLVSIACLLALRCAGQAPPAGGPPDTTPPAIISAYPEQNTTEFRDRRIVLEFSEYVDRRSVEESIFFSPAVGSVEFDWSGKEVELKLGEPLRENITYVVTVGTDVIDLRNRNRMAESFSLAFSTGATIDSALLSGRVFDAKPAGVTVFAYRLDKPSRDTLNPAAARPDYVTQSGTGGSFRLSHLAWGTYRLFAVRDEFKNFLYDPQVDLIGTASRDVELNSARPTVEGLQFRLMKEDTTAPFLLDAKSETAGRIRLRFSEPLDTGSMRLESFSIIDTITKAQVRPSQLIFSQLSPSVVELRTAALDSAKMYRATVGDVQDTAGNPILSSVRSALFQGSAAPDTAAPRIMSMSIRDSLRDIPYDFSIAIQFSEAIRQGAVEKGLRLADSAGAVVPGKIHWFDHTGLRFLPSAVLRPLAWYRFSLPRDSVQDFSGNRLKDSVLVLRIQTIDSRKLGSIRGRVDDPAEGKGDVYLSALNISDKGAKPLVQKLLEVGPFTFENLVQGEYVLGVYRDADGSGVYSHGRAAPFSFSERFAVYPDTVKVRARWPVEGVLLQFGEY